MRAHTPMRALTVHQPFAWAIAAGLKLVENRDWLPGSFIRPGEQIAIHAGKKVLDPLDERFVQKRVSTSAWAGRVIVPGAVIAVANVVGVAERAEQLAAEQRPWFVGRFGWVLANVRALENPVSCRGQQGLWELPGPELFAVVDQIARRP